MDLPSWREKQVAEQALSLLSSDREFDYNDQDILNIILCGELCYLPAEYNVQSFDILQWQPDKIRCLLINC